MTCFNLFEKLASCCLIFPLLRTIPTYVTWRNV